MNKQYLAGFQGEYNPAGNAGTLYTDYKSLWRLTRLAADFARMYGHSRVYLINRPLYDPEENIIGPAAYANKYGKLLYIQEGLK